MLVGSFPMQSYIEFANYQKAITQHRGYTRINMLSQSAALTDSRS